MNYEQEINNLKKSVAELQRKCHQAKHLCYPIQPSLDSEVGMDTKEGLDAY
jgi:hypothetical protein